MQCSRVGVVALRLFKHIGTEPVEILARNSRSEGVEAGLCVDWDVECRYLRPRRKYKLDSYVRQSRMKDGNAENDLVVCLSLKGCYGHYTYGCPITVGVGLSGCLS